MDIDSLTPAQLERLAALAFGSNKRLNFGPFILGAVIDSLLCGVLLMQSGAYASSANNNSLIVKSLVTYVTAMNVWSTAFAWAWIWELFVDNFGTYRTFFSVKYLSWFFLINSATVIAVQSFFGLRAWKAVGRNWALGVTMLLFALAGAGGGVAVKIMFAQFNSTVYAYKLKVPAYICLSCMVAADVMITGIILNYLLRNRTINKRTNHVLSQLTRVTFESQLPPTLIAIALLFVYTTKNDSFVNVPLIWAQPKLYAISLLHTLNVRERLSASEPGTELTPVGCTSSFGASRHTRAAKQAHGGAGLSSVVNTTSWRTPNTNSLSPTIIDPREFDTEQTNENTNWARDVDKAGSHSILSSEQVEEREGGSKAPLV